MLKLKPRKLVLLIVLMALSALAGYLVGDERHPFQIVMLLSFGRADAFLPAILLMCTERLLLPLAQACRDHLR